MQQMPLATIWTEAEFARQNTNSILSSHALLIHAAIADVVGSGNVFKSALEDLNDG